MAAGEDGYDYDVDCVVVVVDGSMGIVAIHSFYLIFQSHYVQQTTTRVHPILNQFEIKSVRLHPLSKVLNIEVYTGHLAASSYWQI